jgi:microcystin-dependent protein
MSNTVTTTGAGTHSGAQTFSGTVGFSGTVTAPTQAITSDSTRLATTAFVRNIIPTGLIVMWSGSVASIPDGWLLCDGTNGTPDLRNRFIVGAGDTYAVAATGGSADAIVVSHTHTATTSITDPGHTHTFTARGDDGTLQGLGYGVVGYDVDIGAGAGGMASATTGITAATTVNSQGSSATNANLPPYYALCFLMKS